MVDFADPLPRQAVPQATAMSAVEGLEQRLRAILDAREGPRRTWPAAALAVSLAFATLPCGLRYEFVGRPASLATLDGCDPDAAATGMPSSRSVAELSPFCCPSFPD